MTSLHVARAWVARQARDARTWVACGVLVLVAGLWPWVWNRQLGAWLAEGPAPSLAPSGMLFGLYIGCIHIASGASWVVRLPAGQALFLRWLQAWLCMAALSASALVGETLGRWGDGTGQVPWAECALAAIAWSALACTLMPWSPRPRRCFLLAVALLWWIPAVLPPSFLLAVPRALRGAFEGAGAMALPGEPRGWLSDTTLVAGLLLLAWAPRRVIGRGDEVRHPG